MRGSVKPVAQALGSISNTWLLNKRVPQEFLGLPVSLPASDLILASAWTVSPLQDSTVHSAVVVFFSAKLCLTLLWLHSLLPGKLLFPWDFPDKNTGASFSFFREAFWPTDWIKVSYVVRQILYHWATSETLTLCSLNPSLSVPRRLSGCGLQNWARPFATRVGTFKDACVLCGCVLACACTYCTCAVAR